MPFMDVLVDGLIARDLVTREAVEGCTEGQIGALLEAQGVTAVPGSYREFLAVAGKNPYWLSRNGEWDYEWLLDAKRYAREMVTGDAGLDFAPFEDAYVFQTHQGYIFYYFRPEDLHTPDPRFWIYQETRPVSEAPWTFTEWVTSLADYLPTALESRRRQGL